MGISPPSDLVLDVVRAADPARVRTAEAALSRLALRPAPFADPPADSASFAASATFRVPAHESTEALEVALANDAALYRPPTPGSVTAGGTADVLRDFEAVTLTTFVKALMPKDATAVFGSGSAGEIFRSMMAEEIAAEVAAAGGIGIARQLERTFEETGRSAAAPSSAIPARG